MDIVTWSKPAPVTPEPTPPPTNKPTDAPTDKPTPPPTHKPTDKPTHALTQKPTKRKKTKKPTPLVTAKPTTAKPTGAAVTPYPTAECGYKGKGKLGRIGQNKLKKGKMTGAKDDDCTCKQYCDTHAEGWTFFLMKIPKVKKAKKEKVKRSGKVIPAKPEKVKGGKCACYSGAEVSSFKSSKKLMSGGPALDKWCSENPGKCGGKN